MNAVRPLGATYTLPAEVTPHCRGLLGEPPTLITDPWEMPRRASGSEKAGRRLDQSPHREIAWEIALNTGRALPSHTDEKFLNMGVDLPCPWVGLSTDQGLDTFSQRV